VDELARLLAGRSAQQLAVTYRRAVARRQRRLLVGELVDSVVDAVE